MKKKSSSLLRTIFEWPSLLFFEPLFFNQRANLRVYKTKPDKELSFLFALANSEAFQLSSSTIANQLEFSPFSLVLPPQFLLTLYLFNPLGFYSQKAGEGPHGS